MNKAHDLARTWETEDCLKDCQDKLEEFRIKRARAASTSQQAHQPIKAPAATTQPAAPPQTKPSEKSTPSANRLTPQA
jgi:hypothetical protein